MKKSKRIRFTQKAIDALPPHDRDSPSRDAEYSDAGGPPGLKLLVSKGGRKTYLLRYTYLTKRKAVRIGLHGAMTPQQARQRALELLAMIDHQGVDPQQEREKARAVPTVEEFVENDYLPHCRSSLRDFRSVESKLRNHILPRFGGKRITDITLRMVQSFHTDMGVKRSKTTANRCLQIIHRFFKLALDWGVLEGRNPASGVQRYPELGREVFLSPEEVGRLIHALNDLSNKVTAAAIKFMLFTGARRSEVLYARWEHVKLEKGVWYLPETKNGRPRHVILNRAARVVLDGIERNGGPWVFPGNIKGNHLVNPTKPFKKALQLAGIRRPVRLHDLRHTFASLAINAGADLHMVSKLLGHSQVKTTERYAHIRTETESMATNQVAKVIEQVTLLG